MADSNVQEPGGRREPGEPDLERIERDLRLIRETMRRRARETERLRGEVKGLKDTVAARDQTIEEVRDQLRRTGSQSEAGRVPSIFFVTGNARSGTTWMMRMLNAHPQILCRGEGRIVGRSYKRPDVGRMDAPTFQPSSLHRAAHDAYYLRKWMERSVWTRDDGSADEHVSRLVRVITLEAFATALESAGKEIVGDKTPYLGHVDVRELAHLFPEATLVHMVRDGRDVAVSAMHHRWNQPLDLGGRSDLTAEEAAIRDRYRSEPGGFGPKGESIFTEARIRNLAEAWRRKVAAAKRDAGRYFAESCVEVRFEALLTNPEREIRPVLAALGARTSRSVVRRLARDASFQTWTKGREAGEEDSTALLRKGVAGDWKQVFTVRDRAIFNEVAGKQLIAMGYERDRDW